jgi:hypothetical protein
MRLLPIDAAFIAPTDLASEYLSANYQGSLGYRDKSTPLRLHSIIVAQ